MIVMKFGGTSVEDATAIDRSCGIVAERISRSPFVVVSALAGTTNGLLLVRSRRTGKTPHGVIARYRG
jgi:aspartate kinase